jgi:hypothetical protein
VKRKPERGLGISDHPEKEKSFVETHGFMNVPGGFTPATAAAPGAISLKNVHPKFLSLK